MARLELQGVSKRFGKQVAVADVDLSIADNEFFCIFGPPASGKTTILKLWLGLQQPDSGRVMIDGRDLAGVPPGERNLAMVFQNLALFPHLTTFENVAFPLRERGVASAEVERRVMDAARRLHIEPLLQKRPGQLSGGERQRVAIGRTLVRDPLAFFMDEPIAALDARLREEMRVELKRLQRELKHTLVYVTHDQEEAMSIADRMAILRDGRIAQVGTPREVYDFPADRYVAELVGSPPMNFVAGRMERGRFQGGSGEIAMSVGEGPDDGDVELGLRPEDLSLVAPGTPEAWNGTVDEIEPLGAVTLVDVVVADQVLRLEVPGQPSVKVGEAAAVRAEAGVCHLFRMDDGRAIWPRPYPPVAMTAPIAAGEVR